MDSRGVQNSLITKLAILIFFILIFFKFYYIYKNYTDGFWQKHYTLVEASK